MQFQFSIKNYSYQTDPGVDPAKEPGPGFYGSTRVNPEKLKNIYLKF